MLNTIVYPDAVADQAMRILTTEYRRAIQGVGWRLARAREIMQAGDVEPVIGWTDTDPQPILYYVKSQHTSHRYIVDTVRCTCSCADFHNTGKRCKHMLAVSLSVIARGRIGFVPEIELEYASGGEAPGTVQAAIDSLQAYLVARSGAWADEAQPAEVIA